METPVAEFTTARKIRFGADAHTSEGERGTVTEVVVDPTTGAAVGVGVRFGMFGRAVYAGFGHLTRATEHEIALDAPRSAMDAAPPQGARLTAATQVTMDGKRVGKLAHITFDGATRAPFRIVVDRGGAGNVAVSARDIVQSGCGDTHALQQA